MKKSIAILSLLVLSPLASATSPVFAPYVSKTIGEIGKGSWGHCRIYPHTAYIKTSKNTLILKFQPIAPEWLTTKIRAASQEQMKVVALHNKATVPAIEMNAADLVTNPTIDHFTLYRDSSDVQKRDGPATTDLLQLVQHYCSQLRAE